MKLSLAWTKGLLWTVLLVLGVMGVWLTYHSYMYPFGDRGCTLRCLHGALLQFAGEHYGNFPTSEKGPFDALQQLYPEYAPSGIELAGVSGNIKAVTNALHKKSGIDETLTSWVYNQGLSKNDDPRLAVLWERRPGLYDSGKRNFFGGRAVLLLNGDITNVPSADWQNFSKQQEQLLQSVESYQRAKKRQAQ